jgi:hypothetical protein
VPNAIAARAVATGSAESSADDDIMSPRAPLPAPGAAAAIRVRDVVRVRDVIDRAFCARRRAKIYRRHWYVHANGMCVALPHSVAIYMQSARLIVAPQGVRSSTPCCAACDRVRVIAARACVAETGTPVGALVRCAIACARDLHRRR